MKRNQSVTINPAVPKIPMVPVKDVNKKIFWIVFTTAIIFIVIGCILGFKVGQISVLGVANQYKIAYEDMVTQRNDIYTSRVDLVNQIWSIDECRNAFVKEQRGG